MPFHASQTKYKSLKIQFHQLKFFSVVTIIPCHWLAVYWAELILSSSSLCWHMAGPADYTEGLLDQ